MFYFTLLSNKFNKNIIKSIQLVYEFLDIFYGTKMFKSQSGIKLIIEF